MMVMMTFESECVYKTGEGGGSAKQQEHERERENRTDMAFLIIIECGENCYSISRKGVDQSQQITLSRLE